MTNPYISVWEEYVSDADLLKERPDYTFDPKFYSAHNGDLAAHSDIRQHYENHGREEGRFGNLYMKARALVPDLSDQMLQIVTDPRLRGILQDGDPAGLELVVEIVALGDDYDLKVSNFSARHYVSNYEDIRNAGVNPFEHYLIYGLREGRHNLSVVREGFHLGEVPFDPEKPTCLICVHEASKTGAPIVGLEMIKKARRTHNVIALGLRGGSLLDQFTRECTAVFIGEDPLSSLEYIDIPGLSKVEFAILNSVESFLFIRFLVAWDIPFAMYIHEYTEYSLPAYKTIHAALFSDLLVYSSVPLYDSWAQTLTDLGVDTQRDLALLPQSPLTVGRVETEDYVHARNRISQLIGRNCAGKRIIYGAGQVQWRKGTDLFVLTAQIAAQYDPNALFIWMGDGRSREDITFGVWLEKHLVEARANTEESNLFFAPSGEYYLDLCKAADSMFMPSRLDPLPNVVFDAAKYGCNITLFRGGTGFDDPLYADQSVLNFVEYGNLDQAVRTLLNAPTKSINRRRNIWKKAPKAQAKPPAAAMARPDAAAPRTVTGEPFEVISAALKASLNARPPAETGSGSYDVPVLFSPDEKEAAWRHKEQRKLWSLGRRYVWQSADAAREALAESGNWLHDSMKVEARGLLPAKARDVPAFNIHIHAHYTDELEDDVARYAAYKAAGRIVVTTDSERKAEEIRAAMAPAGLRPEVVITKNQGRDILPFMKLFYPEGPAGDDDLWCHVHQKKSIGSAEGGDIWRRFLMSNLFGSQERLSDAITRIAQPDAGLVTAFDPYVLGWGTSAPLLHKITSKLDRSMPEHPLLFPIGNMFWVRRNVVEQMNALVGMDYPWPNEPIENDGTIFHLIERLWPLASALQDLNSIFLDNPEEQRK